MLSNVTWLTRSTVRDLQDDLQSADRFVDCGVVLSVVRSDPNGEELIPGKRLAVVRRHKFGGVIDTKAVPPRIVRPSAAPQQWLCSEDQEPIILHSDASPRGQLVEGGMGAGKTTAGVIWTYLRWLEHLSARSLAAEQARLRAKEAGESTYAIPPPAEGGITAPTETRLSIVFSEIFRMFPQHWYRFQSSTGVITMCDATRVRGVSTYQQSEAQGSRVQGFNWSFWFGDELQDQISSFIHAQARLRSGRKGGGKRLATATAKDASDYRNLRGTIVGSDFWSMSRLLGPRSPFVHDDHWAQMASTLSPREFRRLVLAEDMPPELAVYYGWLRSRNLTHLPRICRDVTSAVLAGHQSYVQRNGRFTLLAGHDPGVIYNTTEILKLLMFGDVPTWTVVGELQTKQTTAREHAKQLAVYARETFGVNYSDGGGRLLTFVDPHGKGESQTDYQSVYMAFQKEGLDVFDPAAMSHRIQRKARVEMSNRLLGGSADNAGVPRLVIATDEQRRPVAPRLVEAYESMKKRPGDDDPEGVQRKDEDDKTHAPVATAYALWMFEQEAFTERTVRLALAEARR